VSVQGVIFDAYGTLFDVHSIGKRAEQLFPGMGPSISTLWRDKQIEYSRLVSLADPGPSGSRYYRTFWELTRAALVYALQRTGVRYAAPEIDDLMRGYAALDAFPECANALRAIRSKGLTTAILSNGSPDMLHDALRSSGLDALIDHVISVDSVRQFKTHPMCYELASSRLNVAGESLMFVSSNGWDVMAASWFGFITCWVNRQGLPLETIGDPPHHVLANLEGVERLL
jgi:2-haloacid dehalogenase